MKQSVYDYSFELKRERKNNISSVLIIFFSVVIFLSVVFNFLVFPVKVSSESMETEIQKDSLVFVTPIKSNLNRGDIVYVKEKNDSDNSGFNAFINVLVKFFTAQKIELNASDKISANPCVRRLLAVPGDSIYMKNYVLYIKPQGQNNYLTEFEIISRNYELKLFSVPIGWNETGLKGSFPEIVLGENEYFVLSDNRVEASDSRLWGKISLDSIRGKLLLQYFPFNSIHLF